MRFSLSVLALVVLLAALAGPACGSSSNTSNSRPASSPATTSEGSPSGTASSSRLPSPTPASTPTQTAITSCPDSIVNSSGAYSVQCSAGWQYLNCEATDQASSYTWLINPSEPCRSETYGARMLVISGAGALQPPGYLGAPQSTLNVTVLGVSGTRATYLVTVSNPLPPPKGTVQVLYTFTTGGRKYYLEYDRYPGDADQTALFDAMVTGGLRFSACTPGTQPLPGLCVGRPATVQEEAAMIAVGRPAIEAAFGLQDWSTCSGKAACFRVGDPSRAMVGTNAGTFYGQEGQGPGGRVRQPMPGIRLLGVLVHRSSGLALL